MATVLGVLLILAAIFFAYVACNIFKDQKILIATIANHEGVNKDRERDDLHCEQDWHDRAVQLALICGSIGAICLIM